MGNLVLIACTNVGRAIIEEIVSNPDIKVNLAGVVNLNSRQALTKANYDSYADLAIKYNLDIHYCDNVNDDSTLEFISSKKPDIIIQSGWSQKFGEKLLSIPKYGCIGEHPAPLPKGRGAACVNWAILTGETNWGDSFFQMVSEYDKGALFAQSFFEICEYDNVYSIYQKVAFHAAKTVAANINNWGSGIFDAIVQDDSKATYYKRRTPTDGEITDFNKSAQELHNFIRAQTKPYPGAYVVIDGKKLLLLSSAIYRENSSSSPAGTVLSVSKSGGILVSCKDGTIIEIIRVQSEGTSEEWACDWYERTKIKKLC